MSSLKMSAGTYFTVSRDKYPFKGLLQLTSTFWTCFESGLFKEKINVQILLAPMSKVTNTKDCTLKLCFTSLALVDFQ
jgi:hypothetical protein